MDKSIRLLLIVSLAVAPPAAADDWLFDATAGLVAYDNLGRSRYQADHRSATAFELDASGHVQPAWQTPGAVTFDVWAGLERFDLSELAENIGELYAGSAEDAGIALKCDVAPGVTMLGDATQISRLISNLLDNALKHVPSGGRIVLAISPGPVISVSDDGPGVPAALRPVIFDRFRSGPPVEGKSSHGLGLALAQAIALRHDMTISLLPSAQGAHFVVKPQGTGAIA